MTEANDFEAAGPGLYSEWHGEQQPDRRPLLLIHGGGSTIESNWGALLPELSVSRQVLAVELQGHGHSSEGDRPASFEGSADAVAAVLRQQDVPSVDVLGFSNGGQVALQLAIRHPLLVKRLIVASAPFRRDGMIEGFWAGMEAATFESLPQLYKDADFKASGDPGHAERMFSLDREQMLIGFKDVPRAELQRIEAATLVISADHDVVRPAHALELAEIIPNARLLILPGNHGDYLGEVMAAAGDLSAMRRTLPMILAFLDG
ncbi:alpha/beta fold hydrolase [Psychromicrobium sp. YIM B11713]|uniref:alpha/beta fold hydrolase n=1 Tax=Psychromicrobium sp. YIM B11713 TaxID=3145233 RepID=UPI00374E2E35